MFKLHVLVAGIVIFNILKLIMEIVHNYPITRTTRSGFVPGGGRDSRDRGLFFFSGGTRRSRFHLLGCSK
jgi:hypothetical protein